LKDSIDLRKDCISNIVDCSQQWCSLGEKLEKRGHVEQSDINNFYGPFFKLLEVHITGREEVHGINFDVIDLSGLKIGRLKKAYFFLQDKQKPSLQDIRHISGTVLNLEFGKPLILICYLKTKEIEELSQKNKYNFIR